ncbi:MAG: hypothetical protein HYX33_00380 [Actinobacteria bacterium]|nr:hypothetical protein [Actinomycetota bacterium]
MVDGVDYDVAGRAVKRRRQLAAVVAPPGLTPCDDSPTDTAKWAISAVGVVRAVTDPRGMVYNAADPCASTAVDAKTPGAGPHARRAAESREVLGWGSLPATPGSYPVHKT